MLKSLLALSVAVCAAVCAAAPDAAAFARPAAARHPETWFHLIGGNVAKEGLDADLDAIKAAGISGIHLFHGQMGKDVAWPGVTKRIPCLSADWDDLVRAAAEGCARRGLVFKMQNCPGWSMSGGPWIPPEMAMRNLAYSRVDVPGGAAAGALPTPTWQMECYVGQEQRDYRDLFVLAFPTPEGGDDQTWTPAPAEVTDGAGVMRRVFRLDAPRRVRAITLPSPRQMNHDYSYRPEARVTLVAVAGAVRTRVLDQEVPQGVWQDSVPMTFACDECVADTWEFTLEHRHPMHVPAVTFHAGARLNNWEGLAGWVLRGLVARPAPKQSPAGYVRADEVVDLTDRFRDGALAWTAPTGRAWTVLRIGHVNNGTRNGPAPAEATGWECNKMDRRAIDLHFASYIGRLAKGPLAGGLLKGFVVDSWECCRQTWTDTLEADFRSANGYDFRRKLPAVFGWVLDDPAATERFLLDWRRTLGELVERNYYARMSELAREHGMTAQYETAFGDVLPGDLMRFWKWCDVPMCEFWHPRAAGSVGQDDFKPVRPCVSAARVYGKGRVAAEAFTCGGLTWKEDLKALKRTGNHALARGVTHLVFHTYTHNPCTNALPPGTSFGYTIGTPFLRGQTWWGAMKAFTAYFARCEVLLEAGRPCSDVLWFLGDAVGHKPSETSPLPAGFAYDYCNPDALLTRVAAQDGRLVLPDGVSYKVLWVPEGTYVAPKSEAKLRALIKKAQDMGFHALQSALLPAAFLGLLRKRHNNAEIHVRPLKIAVRLGAEEIAVPHFVRGIGKALWLQIQHLALFLAHKGLCAKGRQQLVFLSGHIFKNAGQRGGVNAFFPAHDLNAHGLKIHFFFGKDQLEQNAHIGVQVRPLIIRVENKVAQRIENRLAIVKQLVVFGHMGVMRHHHIRAKL